MVLELHIWGPAFALPSLDPQCLATIAYFVLALGPANRREWVLIPDSDPSLVPTNELPALWTGTRWISRFRNIVAYLRQYSDGEWDLDRQMDSAQRADCVAFSSFLESDGQPLIDLSLYVSSENYHSATAPAYASLLQWPNQWIIPPQMRSLARKRTEHLGLSSLDLDVMEEEAKQQRSRDDGTAAGQIPVSLARPPRETVSGLLGKTSQQNRIRLDGMTGAFVAPLEELLGGKGHLLSDEIPSSLDCVALGYLSLALVPDLPYPWLSQAVRAHTPRLVSYVNRLWEKCFGSAVDVKTVFLDAAEGASGLPWEAPERISVGRMGKRVLEGLADATPVLREIRASQRLQQAGKDMDVGADLDRELVEKLAQARRREAYAATATVAAGLGLFAGYLVQAGIVTFGLQPDETEADGAGEEAGDAAPLET